MSMKKCSGLICDVGAVVWVFIYFIFGETIDLILAVYLSFIDNLDHFIGIATLVLILLRIRKHLKGG